MRLVVKSREKKTNIFVKVLVVAAKILGSTAMAIIVYKFLAPLAAAERGYAGAVGGELILTVAAFCAVYKVFDFAFDSMSD